MANCGPKPTDQRSKIGTFNIAPSWTRVVNTNSVLTFGTFVRRDDYNYYPSKDPFSDLGPRQPMTGMDFQMETG